MARTLTGVRARQLIDKRRFASPKSIEVRRSEADRISNYSEFPRGGIADSTFVVSVAER
jgi:hypothetical protein